MMSRHHLKISANSCFGEVYKKIECSICSLLNCRGGYLTVKWEDNPPQNILDGFLKKVEQKAVNLFSTKMMQNIFKVTKQTKDSFTLYVPGSPSLKTLNYNFYLPTETQALKVQPVQQDCRQHILEVIERKVFEVHKNDIPQELVNNKHCGLRESQTVQLKETFPKTLVDLEKFMKYMSDKLGNYVSAFANHNGGLILYGVMDDGIVKGETLSQEQKDKRSKDVHEYIYSVMKYGDGDFPENVAVTFVPVQGEQDDLYVTVVSIPPCCGGVFTSTPESYTINKDGKVRVIQFTSWLELFKVHKQPWLMDAGSLLTEQNLPWSSDGDCKLLLPVTWRLTV